MSEQPLIAPLERLGLEVERMALAAERAPRRGGRARLRRLRLLGGRRRGLVIALALLLLLAAAAAIAASGLLSGDPVRNPSQFIYKSDRSLGTVVPGSAHLTTLRVADPVGGPPWGIRTLRTTRKMGCVQIGRVVDGQLGVLGQDGVFGNDGKFHALPPDVLSQAQCRSVDAAGHLFVAISASGMPASGLSYGCLTRPVALPGGSRPAVCPPADLRDIRFGALGPRGIAIDHADPATGRVVTQRAAGADHAYLVVTRPRAKHPALGGWFTGATPASGLKAVHYDDGTTCRVTSGRFAGGARPCPAKGYVAVAVAPGSTRAEITATMGPSRTFTGIDGRPYRERQIAINFVAPVATPDARTFYTYSLVVRSRHGFAKCGWGGQGGPVERTVRGGQRVTVPVYVRPTCHYPIDITVRLHSGRPDDPDAYESRRDKGDALVGTTTIRP